MRLLVAGLAAAAVFGAAAVGLLVLLDGPARPAQVAAPAAPAAEQARADLVILPPPSAPAGALAAAIPDPPARPAIRGARLARATSPWEEVPVAARESQLGPVAPFVRAGLAAARDQMDSCFDEEDARQKQHPTSGAAGAALARGPGVLVLRLESRQDGLDVVGTEVESYGTSSPELTRCAAHVLAGWPVEARGATAGVRYRLKFPLQ